MLTRVIQVLIAGIILTTVGTASYFGGVEHGRRAAAQPIAGPPALQGQPSQEESDVFRVFWEAWNLVDREFYNQQSIDHTKMTYGAIKGMLETLDDPYTNFANPVHGQVTEEDMRGSFDGIGVVVEVKDKKLTVVAPQEDSPGARAGIKPGDIIVKVDGQDTEKLNLLEAVALIRGPRGSKVTLTIVREGEPAPLEIQVTRAEIKVVNVRTRMLEGDVAYVKLNGFAVPTGQQLADAVRQATSQKPKGLILDLRNNPGGLLNTAVEIAAVFMRDGVVLHEDGRDGSSRSVPVRRGRNTGVATEQPMVVLVNKGSASASEIVAGALQDNGRAILVGEATFGKDTVQNVHDLSDKSSVRITIARWATPKRQEIHQKGLQPDIEVKLTEEDLKNGVDPQLMRAVEYLLGR